MTTPQPKRQSKASRLAAAADRLGAIKIAIAQLEREQTEIKEMFIDHGLNQYDGETYRVTLTSTLRTTLDMKAVREKLSKAWQDAHSNTTHVMQMRVMPLGDFANIVHLPDKQLHRWGAAHDGA